MLLTWGVDEYTDPLAQGLERHSRLNVAVELLKLK